MNSFIFSKHFILVSIVVDPDLSLERYLGTKLQFHSFTLRDNLEMSFHQLTCLWEVERNQGTR